jgi:hypothetical protein
MLAMFWKAAKRHGQTISSKDGKNQAVLKKAARRFDLREMGGYPIPFKINSK